MLLTALIEIPKNSPIKLEYNPVTGLIEQDFIFKDGFVFKYNYGFIPGTLAEDGDALDVMVITDEIIPSGTTIQIRTIGMIELLDRGVADNKILALPAQGTGSNFFFADLTKKDFQEMRDFYVEIGRQKNKLIEIKGFFGKQQALKEIEKCKFAFRIKNPK